MNFSRTFETRALRVALFLSLILLFSSHALPATDPPADVCTMLPAGELAKVLEQPYGSAAKSVAPAAYRDSPTGTDCTYQAEKGASRTLLFRIYVEASAGAAKATFDKLSFFYRPSTPAAGNWDTGYVDSRHAIHVQKGKVRYYLELDPRGTDTAKGEKQVEDLASWVAGQL
jgi:hypothetical protein